MCHLRRTIKIIDCHYVYEEFAASYLIIDGQEAAFVDNNTAHSVHYLLDTLAKEHMRPEQVRYIIVTHVHLDHAGGTSELLKHCCNAMVLAHPRAKRHIVDPSKLIASAQAVYGEDNFKKLYGSISPINESRVAEVLHGATVPFGTGAGLKFLHTRGHANHHFCIYEPENNAVFTGDAFGLCYPYIGGGFIFPSTSPTDFLYSEAVQSVDDILNTGADKAYLTHFGAVTDLTGSAHQLKQDLSYSEDIRQELIKYPTDYSTDNPADQKSAIKIVESKLREHISQRLLERGLTLTQEQWNKLRLDLELNAQGIVWAATHPK